MLASKLRGTYHWLLYVCIKNFVYIQFKCLHCLKLFSNISRRGGITTTNSTSIDDNSSTQSLMSQYGIVNIDIIVESITQKKKRVLEKQ